MEKARLAYCSVHDDHDYRYLYALGQAAKKGRHGGNGLHPEGWSREWVVSF